MNYVYAVLACTAIIILWILSFLVLKMTGVIFGIFFIWAIMKTWKAIVHSDSEEEEDNG